MQESIRVGVLDEREGIRQGLCTLLDGQVGIAVHGSYRDAADALLDARQGRLDLILMDHMLEKSDAIGLISVLIKECPQLRILTTVGNRHGATASMLMALGAHGVISKRQGLTEYVKAVRSLAFGEVYLCPCLADDVPAPIAVPAITGVNAEAESFFLDSPLLSLREREVLRMYISGKTVTQIAKILSRSLKTVSAQKLSAYRKLGLRSDVELFKAIAQKSLSSYFG
ncbi:LuxR C-terminal-related transcriptional regulator [Pseudomonas fluorescens]|uniref:LuxR C-terminal-related transcriptional regulator n=1 Tax=Pseudomonas fluorescens TaxID=294 RepID=UPI001A9EB090|nr:response regulator transcription factor [Pseudomonas fluorescens]QTD31480.1 response regulator transcription factor [Pseudomonas fluorescens]